VGIQVPLHGSRWKTKRKVQTFESSAYGTEPGKLLTSDYLALSFVSSAGASRVDTDQVARANGDIARRYGWHRFLLLPQNFDLEGQGSATQELDANTFGPSESLNRINVGVRPRIAMGTNIRKCS
jgi:hypothetical protein